MRLTPQVHMLLLNSIFVFVSLTTLPRTGNAFRFSTPPTVVPVYRHPTSVRYPLADQNVARRTSSSLHRRQCVAPSRHLHHLLLQPLDRDDHAYYEDAPTKAYPQQTPHSGRHFHPSHPAYDRPWWSLKKRGRRRFMEGWYYRLTLPDQNASFAFIVSIEDPGRHPPSDLRLACIQIVGPDDGYLVQADREDTKFWAWQHRAGLGCVFEWQPGVEAEVARLWTVLHPDEWHRTVHSGFQMLPSHLVGRIHGHDGTHSGALDGQGVPGYCDFDLTVTPLCGWGDDSKEQKSTGGWLSRFEVFEPHWQVTMADGRATGSVTWKNQTYRFTDAPFYAEKNWGAALPTKWYWTQCNSFEGFEQLSVTAGGGIRLIPFGRREKLGMICIHFNGTFYEGVPWTGAMEWTAKWGYWELRGNSTYGDHPFEAVVTYACDPAQTPGLVFRAPTPDEGMVYFCRDTFDAIVTLTLWELERDPTTKRYKRKAGPPLIDGATSAQGGAEIGGGPWWDEWVGISRVKQPIKTLLQVPFRLQALQRRLTKSRQQ